MIAATESDLLLVVDQGEAERFGRQVEGCRLVESRHRAALDGLVGGNGEQQFAVSGKNQVVNGGGMRFGRLHLSVDNDDDGAIPGSDGGCLSV